MPIEQLAKAFAQPPRCATKLSDSQNVAIEAINGMSNEERKSVREQLEAMGIKFLPRNLYYNYKTQQWID